MTAQARFMVSQGNCPGLTSGRTAKDSVAQTQIHRGQDDLGFARSWGILERFGHSLYYWEELFSQQRRTEGFHLRWCPWSWRNCDTGAMMRAKPTTPEMRQNQSGDEYQADDQVAGRPTISPLPLLQGGALLFALRPYFARAGNLYLMAISCSHCQQIGLSAVEQTLHFFQTIWYFFHFMELCYISGDWTEPRLTVMGNWNLMTPQTLKTLREKYVTS